MTERQKLTKWELARARSEVTLALSRLESLFKPQCKLTFLMRDPGNDECSMLITNDDDLPAVRRVIEALEKKPRT